MPPETPKNHRTVALSDVGVTNRETVKGCGDCPAPWSTVTTAPVSHPAQDSARPGLGARPRDQPRPRSVPFPGPGPFPRRSTGPPRRPPRVLQAGAGAGRCGERGPRPEAGPARLWGPSPGACPGAPGGPGPGDALARSPQSECFSSPLRNCVPSLSAPARPAVLPSNRDLVSGVSSLLATWLSSKTPCESSHRRPSSHFWST